MDALVCDGRNRGLGSILGNFWLMVSCCGRTQLFIDAEARMDTYEDKDGIKRTQLNLLMRTCWTWIRDERRMD